MDIPLSLQTASSSKQQQTACCVGVVLDCAPSWSSSSHEMVFQGPSQGLLLPSAHCLVLRTLMWENLDALHFYLNVDDSKLRHGTFWGTRVYWLLGIHLLDTSDFLGSLRPPLNLSLFLPILGSPLSYSSSHLVTYSPSSLCFSIQATHMSCWCLFLNTSCFPIVQIDRTLN